MLTLKYSAILITASNEGFCLLLRHFPMVPLPKDSSLHSVLSLSPESSNNSKDEISQCSGLSSEEVEKLKKGLGQL